MNMIIIINSDFISRFLSHIMQMQHDLNAKTGSNN